ncbi:GIY-YIG nuclease family protein [Mangrovicoccus algicola]|uniref:GIY-YIG nuclease family protein n=1 Tax=Mangrovicoccus algicola TaxID=2771008 RepID=A0A8J6Z1X4_9RHOB|nr:GIY-YIG nuclease family protein [Mangrovicoccus algicola]MBE3640101.1 GIY-YIG nuclease family protein [Mangrovicoccus algicola]
MGFHAYIMASHPLGVLHIAATGDLAASVARHRAGRGGAHTARYAITRLVWFEPHPDYGAARLRARRIARWRRAWKDALITAANPDWHDLTSRIPP